MELYDVSWQITDLLETNRSVYLRTEPEIPDFTRIESFKILLFGTRSQVELTVDRDNIATVISLFDSTIFNSESVDRLYIWNIKSLASYFRFFWNQNLRPASSIIDLKVIENFLNIRKTRPENLIEAVNRAKVAIKQKGWQSLYKSIHLPLSLRILPSIESIPLLDSKSKKTVHPYYEIEGQNNGRMNCVKKFAKSYLPHNMGPDVRNVLKPRGESYHFIYADFKHCEINVLQWLSKDPRLAEIIISGADLHQKIYEIITGDQCNTDVKRKKSKMIFLPVMYGCGPKTLATNVGVSEAVGKELINRIKISFPISWGWLQKQQEAAKTSGILDYFGRPRSFAANESYQARNFVVQGVAATFCQEKLIELHTQLQDKAADIVFSVHDGFGIIAPLALVKETSEIIKQVTESESKLCPGLKMNIDIKSGPKLDQLENIK